MKASRIVIALLLTAVIIAGCSKSKPQSAAPAVEGAPETGVTIDITEKDDTALTVAVGDILYLKLTGEAASGKQWSATSPTSGEYILLKDHKVTDLINPSAPNGQFTDEWRIKVNNPGEFTLQFSYGAHGQKVIDTFDLAVTAQ